MNLSTSFSVPLPVEDSWSLLQDMERVARWMPGAKLEQSEGDTYKGAVRVKLGPMVVDYRGTARLVERDDRVHRVVFEASGREQRGNGVAKAVAVTQLEPGATGTEVSVSVDLDISGRPSQLGQGLIQDVAERVVAEFSERMKADLLSLKSDPGPSGGSSSSPEAADSRSDGVGSSGAEDTGTDVLDLGRVVAPGLIRRAAPVIAVLVGLVVAYVLGRTRSRASSNGTR